MINTNSNILTKIHNEVNRIKLDNILIIVEGKRDIIALKKLNLVNVIELNKPIFQLCEEVAINNKIIIILMDNDSEGRKLYDKLKINFNNLGIKIDNTLRNLLLKTKLSHIEGLNTYLKHNS